MVLHATEMGEGRPVLILHGMLGSGRNWQQVSRLLSPRFRILALDLRSHGASPRGEPMDFPSMAEDVVETMAASGIQDATFIGHSMGGKVAMVLALTRPAVVRSLVIVDIAPARYPTYHLRLVRAMRAVDLGELRRRSEVDEALSGAVPEKPVRAFLLQGLTSLPDGRLIWRMDLELLERAMPVLSDFPPLEDGSPYRGPTLFIAGGRSPYVREEHRAAIAALFPGARVSTIEDAGHWVQAERPEAFVAMVSEFLEHGRPAPSG